MPEELNKIIINRIDRGYIELDRRVSVNVDSERDIVYIPIKNYGPPTHVFISVDPEMKNIAYLPESNYYVDDEVKIPLIIQLPTENNIYTINIIITASYGLSKEKFSITAIPKNLKRKEEESQKEINSNPAIPAGVSATDIKRVKEKKIISNGIKTFFGRLYKNK